MLLLAATSACGGARASSQRRAGADTVAVDWPQPPTRSENDVPEVGHAIVDQIEIDGVIYRRVQTPRSNGCEPSECLDSVQQRVSQNASVEVRPAAGVTAGTLGARGLVVVLPLGTIRLDAYVLEEAIISLSVASPPEVDSTPQADAFLASARPATSVE